MLYECLYVCVLVSPACWQRPLAEVHQAKKKRPQSLGTFQHLRRVDELRCHDKVARRRHLDAEPVRWHLALRRTSLLAAGSRPLTDNITLRRRRPCYQQLFDVGLQEPVGVRDRFTRTTRRVFSFFFPLTSFCRHLAAVSIGL